MIASFVVCDCCGDNHAKNATFSSTPLYYKTPKESNSLDEALANQHESVDVRLDLCSQCVGPILDNITYKNIPIIHSALWNAVKDLKNSLSV